MSILRFSTIPDFRVVGIAEKFLAHYEYKYHPKEFFCYVDKRWRENELYESLGFEKIYESEPNYWYIKTGISEKDEKFKKRMHPSLFAGVKTPDKTEWEIMREKGFDRIWDCGNILFSKKVNQNKENEI